MQRIARSMSDATVLSKEEFEKQSFFNVFEVDNAYLDLHGEWQKSPNMKTLVREDGSYIQSVGKGYKWENNESVFNRTINALDSNGIEWQPRYSFIEKNGLRSVMEITLPQFELFSKDDKERSHTTLKIINPLDRLNAIAQILGTWRLVCTNGAVSFVQDFNMKIRHNGDIADKIEKGLELYQNFEETMKHNQARIEWMAESKGTRNAVAKYFDAEEGLSTVLKGERWSKKLNEKWGNEHCPVDLWSIYNIFTYMISHEFGHDYTKKVASMEKLNAESMRWHRILEVKTKGFTN